MNISLKKSKQKCVNVEYHKQRNFTNISLNILYDDIIC